MTVFRLALLAALALIATMSTGVGIAAAQEEPQSLAPSGLTAEICGNSACLSWTRGSDDYTWQEILYWETDDSEQTNMGRLLIEQDASEATIHLALLVLTKRTDFESGGKSYTFQIAGLKGDFFNRYHSGYSNRAFLYVPAQGMEVAPEEPAEEEQPAPEEPDENGMKSVPSKLRAAQDGGSVLLSWMPGNNPNYIEQVALRREAVRGAEFEVIRTFTREAEEMDIGGYSDDTAEAGKRYIYRIKALKANGKGAMSNAAKITVH